jgi:deoxyadenosine/deoxycytidine kinase
MSVPRKYVIEGNIGAGKSTLLDVLARELNKNELKVEIRPEPVNLWGDLLEKFYADKKRWSYIMQNNAFITRTLEVIKPVTAPVVFYERSVFIDRFCFAEMLHEDESINSTEWRIYNTWYHALVEKFNLVPDGFIYLRCDPEMCMKRIDIRALTLKHDDLFINGRISKEIGKEIPILTVDRNGAFEDPDYLNSIIAQIKIFTNIC